RGIKNKRELMPLANFDNTFVLAGIAPHPNKNHSAGSRRDLALDIIRVEAEILIDIGENRRQTLIHDGMVGRNEGQWRGDDFITFGPTMFRTKHVDRQMQSRGR